MSLADGTPLDTIDDVPTALIAALKAAWITTAEQFVAAAAASGGADTLASHLGLPVSDVRRGLEAAEATLSSDERTRLSRPADTSGYGLGARGPETPD